MDSIRFITPAVLLKYRISEIMHQDGRFMIMLFHPDEYYPGVCAKVRYIESTSGFLAAFSAFPVFKSFKITLQAYEDLEFEILSIVENMTKCTFVKSVTIPTVIV